MRKNKLYKWRFVMHSLGNVFSFFYPKKSKCPKSWLFFLTVLFLCKPISLLSYQTQIEAHLACCGKEIQKRFFTEYYGSQHEQTFSTQNKVVLKTRLPEDDSLIQELIKNARYNAQTHYECYHAQASSLRIVQDLYKEIRILLDELVITHKDFHFLRFNDPIFSRYTGIHDFLTDKLADKEEIHDGERDMSTSLLSVNFSPFGNYDIDGESTFDFYLYNFSVQNVAQRLALQIVRSLGFTENGTPLSYSIVTHALEELLHTHSQQSRGSLFQLLIPKKNIDTIGYTSHSYGIPATAQEKDQLSPLEQLSFKTKTVLINKLYDNNFSLSLYLESYRKEPEKIRYLTNLQGRLLITQDQFLNPASGIIIKRFTALSPEQEELYNQAVKNVAELIIKEWLALSDQESSSVPENERSKKIKLWNLLTPPEKKARKKDKTSRKSRLKHADRIVKILRSAKNNQVSDTQVRASVSI